MTACCTCLLLLFLASCSSQPGKTLEFSETTLFSLDGISLNGRTISGSYTLAAAAEREWLLFLGNPHPQLITLSVQGADMDSVDLLPNRWTRVRLTAGAAPVGLSWSGGDLYLGEPYLKPKGWTRQPNLLLLSIDTLRFDAFSAEHMPEIRAIFNAGTVFQRAYTTAPWTLPAHVSMLTGQYPAKHGVREPDGKLPQGAMTLARVLREHGYYTLAATEGNYLAAIFGLAQGFAAYRESPPQMMDRDPARISMLQSNLGWLRRQLADLEDIPKFVFLHTYEVHCPYLPREGTSDPQGIGMTKWLLDNEGTALGAPTFDQLRKLYEGEVRYTDRTLAPLLRELAESGNWTIVLVSDHGEEFGEHGGLLHSDTVYEEVAHIPMAMLGKGIPAGQLRLDPCSLTDLAPTLAALTDAPPSPEWQGLDLFALPPDPRPVFSESFFLGPHIPAEDPRVLAVWFRADKLIQSRNFQETTAELYDLDTDPAETRDLQAEKPDKRDALYLFLEEYLAGRAAIGERVEGFTAEQLEVMRSLGYIK